MRTGVARWALWGVVMMAAAAHAQTAELARYAPVLAPLVELSHDYIEAIESGKPEELELQSGLVRRAQEQAKRLALSLALEARLDRLAALVGARAAPLQVHDAAVAAIRALLEERRLALAPARAPDLARAPALYATACAVCHGAKGAGDGLAAPGLQPRPVSFLEADVMNPFTPLEVFVLLSAGCYESPMPSFETLSDDERWSLAFYVFTLRYSRCEGGVRPVALKELATTSDNELAARYLERSLACLRRELKSAARPRP